MVKDHDLGDLYTIVQEGTWTFDRFQTMCETVLQDVNGDGAMGEDDIYGYTARSSAVMPAFWVGGDVESAAMLDLIMDNLVFDAADTFLGTEFRDGTMLECFYKNQQDVTSALTEKQNVYQTTLDTYNEAFAALEK